ncbi:hypothetical protein KRX51_02215 [Corynebacterium sp. TAE3-ERU12]|uniref:hypothetical protein n=1 Tax=Corynebacterium sp. TAE3-ERU12 TaxID=2849491 RepID=UPI001C460AD8|nr:hypothetical protein [Corynebacterium sp. TAE3-ERU12]MBV7294734.1 hypothetical protein [Corynebacterium sp. TAE3-ERU12]
MEAVPDLSGLDRSDAIAALRRSMSRIAAVPDLPAHSDVGAAGAGGASAGGAAGAPTGQASTGLQSRFLPVPAALSGVLHGALVRGAVTELDTPGTLLAGIVAAVTESGGHIAIVGLPGFLPTAAAEQGADLSRILVVPDPGERPLEVLGTLADGVDLVAAALNRTPPPSYARPVQARLRTAGTALLYLGHNWPGAAAQLSSRLIAVHGLGRGHGRIRALEHEVSAAIAGRAPQRVTWVVGADTDPVARAAATEPLDGFDRAAQQLRIAP